jgi:hypothetical protein
LEDHVTEHCCCREKTPEHPTIRYYETGGEGGSVLTFTDRIAPGIDFTDIAPIRRKIAALRLRAFADILDPYGSDRKIP